MIIKIIDFAISVKVILIKVKIEKLNPLIIKYNSIVHYQKLNIQIFFIKI